MQNSETISGRFYKRNYSQTTGKKFWLSPGVTKKFKDLDSRLKDKDVDIESYISFCTDKYPPCDRYVFVPVNIVCSNKTIQGYIDSYQSVRKLTDREDLFSTLFHIERTVAAICIKAYTLEYWDPNADLSEYFEELENYCNFEFILTYLGNCTYDEGRWKYPKMYDEVVRRMTEDICHYNKIEYSTDYKIIAARIIERKENERRYFNKS